MMAAADSNERSQSPSREKRHHLSFIPEASPPSSRRYYVRVAVLLIRWADELDELKTGQEVEELYQTFRERYNFDVEVVELNLRKKPKFQLKSHVSNFICQHDGPHNLLVVFYTGHSIWHSDKHYLELSANNNPAIARGFFREARVDWNAAENQLRHEDVESDVLVILDAAYASNSGQNVTSPSPRNETVSKMIGLTDVPVKNLESTHVESSRLFDLLAACPVDETTAGPGRFSFTRALIDVLNEIIDEDPESSFTTWDLNQKISKRPERADTSSQLWSRLPNRDGTRICISRHRSPDIAAYESMDESCFSDTSSIWSEALSGSSQSSYGELHYVTQSATKKMAEVFWQSTDLHSLYLQASNRLSRETFSRAHDDVLKTFFEDLRSETVNEKQLKTVRILRHRAHRQQITEWVYSLASPRLDAETLQARQNFLSQREDRDELLEQFLQASTNPGKVVEQPEQAFVPDNDSSDEEEEDPISLEELNSIVSFLVGGSSFETLRIHLYSLAHPENAIAEALQTRKIGIVRALLSKQLKRVAVGDFAWIKELDTAGYTTAEIAQLLIEEKTDSPWITFTPQTVETDASPVCDPEFHVRRCIHGSETCQPGRWQDSVSSLESEDFVQRVQELCGIAGIVPSSQDKDNWKGSVKFSEENTVAAVTYTIPNTNLQNAHEMLLDRCVHSLQRLISAIGHLQNSGVCCNSYTAIVYHGNMFRFDEHKSRRTVHLHKIQVKSLMTLLQEALNLQANIAMLQFPENTVTQRLQESACDILKILGEDFFPTRAHISIGGILNLLAISVQFASLAFLSYSQAHIAPVQPFFLDTALDQILLLGVNHPTIPSFQVVAQTTSLSCIGDMLGSEVTVFTAVPMDLMMESTTVVERTFHKFDVIASAEDLIDIWDAGGLVAPTSRAEDGYYAIQLCGGIIFPVAVSEPPVEIPDTEVLFHWSSTNTPRNYDRTFELSQPIRIGALVTVNNSCTIDEHESWRSSASAFEILGVRDNVWRHEESQFGGQAGQYVVMQYNRTKNKIPGRTLKAVLLDDLQSKSYLVGHSLNNSWGVQVSFCTGVARRVPLRILMADLIPVFMTTMSYDKDMWETLNKGNRAIEALQSENVLEWLRTLDQLQSEFLNKLMHDILRTLESTGVDEEGNELTVAWIYQHPPYRCFKVSCNDKKNSWMRVLSDSGDCATFAYIVTRCLETSTIKCRGPSPYWHSTAPLLETAVLRHDSRSTQPTSPLEHKKTYFFKKMDSLLQVTVERQSFAGPVSLYISPSSIPAKFRQRLYNLERMRNQVSRIKERKECSEMGAEDVAIQTKAESRF